MFVTLVAAAISVQAAPAAEVQYRSHDVSGALQRGCKVQRVSVAGGKAEHAAIIRCPANAAEAKNPARAAPGA
ncbi:hypothetical protein E5A73_03975 [Sphingomonas gei]|uniref:Uncharacterized protein n=1 Tax=Sphingomonas gei TaxID=1395960 RepID=A0A4S1XK54_9SPHN|nr:hypothetical protein [Sphingomonas gei]TGX56253.1 hypothetical protein E5A73_03975 [Sphingomonas gei]